VVLSGRLHILATLNSGKEPLISLSGRLGMPQSCRGQFGREKKSLSFVGNSSVLLVFPACTPVTDNYNIVAYRVDTNEK
jgi:hypothetical protein